MFPVMRPLRNYHVAVWYVREIWIHAKVLFRTSAWNRILFFTFNDQFDEQFFNLFIQSSLLDQFPELWIHTLAQFEYTFYTFFFKLSKENLPQIYVQGSHIISNRRYLLQRLFTSALDGTSNFSDTYVDN